MRTTFVSQRQTREAEGTTVRSANGTLRHPTARLLRSCLPKVTCWIHIFDKIVWYVDGKHDRTGQIDGFLIGDDALDRFVRVTDFAVSALSRTAKTASE